jgi:hypothetical protein
MPETTELNDREMWEKLKAKFGSGPFRFKDVADLCSPDRAYEFMNRASEEGWIQSDDDNETYELNSDAEPERSSPVKPTSQTIVPGTPSEFKEWYRGTKFHLGQHGTITWVSPRKKVKIRVVGGFENVLEKLQSILPNGGSFRVDEQGRILLKDPNREYLVSAIGKVKSVKLDVIERDPRDRVKPGYIWPSIYDGSRYHISPDRKAWFRNPDGTRRYVKTGHESLVDALLKYKPQGGGFRITENGRVLTLRFTLPVPEEARSQWESLTDEERNIIMARETPGQALLIPIFVTDFRGKIELGDVFDIHKPWSTDERDEFFEMLASRKEVAP